jgi:hypothetical protein
MPFIINHIDTLATIASATLKVFKFAATVAHYIALAIGAVLILTGCWLVTARQHFTGETQTVADVTEAVHGPVLAEYGVAKSVTPGSYLSVAPAVYSLTRSNDWVLEDAVAPIESIKQARKRQSKKAALVAA